MSFINSKNKADKWWAKNYFYIATILIIIINVGLIYYFGINWSPAPKSVEWNSMFDFQNMINNFFSAFDHLSWSHCILNMICFFVTGTYIERKIGSFNLIALVIFFAFICENTIAGNHFGGWSVGFSGVNYALYAFILIDYFYEFFKNNTSKANVIYGTIVLILIYLAMTFKGGDLNNLQFDIYPIDLLYNMGHYSAFLTSLVLTIAIKIVKHQTLSENN